MYQGDEALRAARLEPCGSEAHMELCQSAAGALAAVAVDLDGAEPQALPEDAVCKSLRFINQYPPSMRGACGAAASFNQVKRVFTRFK